jgi:TonB family protein
MWGCMTYRILIFILALLLPHFAKAAEPYEVSLTKHMALSQRYPDDAKLYGIEGDAIVRVRVAPNGKILRYWVLEEPKHPSLKKAVADMLKRANPAPKVPKSYLKGDPYAELIFPIAFRVHAKAGYLDDIDKRFQSNVKKAFGEQTGEQEAAPMQEESIPARPKAKPTDESYFDTPIELPLISEPKNDGVTTRQNVIKGTFD